MKPQDELEKVLSEQLQPSEEDLQLAREALERLDARKDEPVEVWAQRLAADLAKLADQTTVCTQL